MKIAFVMGDREAPETEIAMHTVNWHLQQGYDDVVVGSSWPQSQLLKTYYHQQHLGRRVAYGSVDHLLPYNPAEGHAHQQLHRRIWLAVRLGSAALAFEDPTVDTVVLGDSDMLMLRKAEHIEALLDGHEAYAQTLNFLRPEAPYGWYSDLGMVLTRKGFDRIRRYLPEEFENILAAAGPEASVHGLLYLTLQRCGVYVKEEPLEGYYKLPMGIQRPYLKQEMPEDSWLNCFHLLTADNEPYCIHVDMKTRIDTGWSVRDEYLAILSWMAQNYRVTWPHSVDPVAWKIDWIRIFNDSVHTLERTAKVKHPEHVFYQDWGFLQKAAKHFTETGEVLPYRRVPTVGTVTPLGKAEVETALRCRVMA